MAEIKSYYSLFHVIDAMMKQLLGKQAKRQARAIPVLPRLTLGGGLTSEIRAQPFDPAAVDPPSEEPAA